MGLTCFSRASALRVVTGPLFNIKNFLGDGVGLTCYSRASSLRVVTGPLITHVD